jgi:hypothetical protein
MARRRDLLKLAHRRGRRSVKMCPHVPAASLPPSPSAAPPATLLPHSWLEYGGVGADKNDKAELAFQTPPAAPTLSAPCATPQPASWASAVDSDDDDEEELAP